MNTASSLTYPCEVLTFQLGSEEYGMNILKVQEIRAYENVTRIANAPDFVKGVINLRGIIVPIIDLRLRFHSGTPTYDQFTVVIVLNVSNRVIGVVVDRVSEVVTLTDTQIRPAPEMGTVVDMDYLIGLGVVENHMLILVDIEHLLTASNMGLFERLAA